MTITASPTLTSTTSPPRNRTSPDVRVHGTRTTRDDFRAVPTVLTSEWIKLSTVRANKAILGLTVAINGFAAWAVATSVKDEVLTVSKVFVFPALLTAVLAAVA